MPLVTAPSPRKVVRAAGPVRCAWSPWRRLLAASVVLALAPAAWAAAGEREFRFRVFLDNVPVGYHRIVLRPHGDDLEVDIDARFDVKLLSVPLFHYRHQATEHWRAGCVTSLVAKTDDNGRRREVDAEFDGEALRVVSARGEETLPGCVMTYAYWNPAILGRDHLLNAQTGEYQAVKVTHVGEDTIARGGGTVPAARYRIDTGKHDIDLWYSRDGQWLGLESVVALGRRLRYRAE